MKVERIFEGFVFLPSINLNWYTWRGKRHYYLSFAWLFWYIATMKKFKWEEEQ